uniref:Polymeric immunoglobulin receptor-like n=1 Tax=Poecilia latipinna TaxID=48699 RepID=A0A3B3VH53_9TELE
MRDAAILKYFIKKLICGCIRPKRRDQLCFIYVGFGTNQIESGVKEVGAKINYSLFCFLFLFFFDSGGLYLRMVRRESGCCDTVNNIQGNEDGSVTISCPYDSQSVNKLKFFCRGNRPSTCLQQAVITSSNTQDGRFRLSDDRKSGIFTVTISSLTLKDSGSYLCGVQRNSGFDVFTAVELEVKGERSNLCTCNVISKTAGHEVTLQCPYPPNHQNNRKFLCRGSQRSNCTDMMKGQSRFLVHSDFSGAFSVKITQLEAGDAGTYWCRSEPEWNVGNYTQFHLSVGERHTGHGKDNFSNEDGSVTISCPYDSQSVNKLKFFCRGNRPSTCLQQAVITSSNTQDGRFRLSDDRKSGIFTVTISSLTLKDSGSYLCGVQRNSGFDVFTAVELEVKGSIRVFGYEGGDVNVSCPYDRGFEGHQKYLCNHDCRYADVLITTSQGSSGKYSIHDDKTTRIFTVTISDLRLDDAGKYWCGVTRIGRDISIERELEVKPDKFSVTFAVSNSSVTISCPYDSQSVNKLKFFCRGNRPSTCLQQAVITSSNTQDGRFRLSDDRKSGIFTVTISSLTLKDSGSYLCGVQRNSGFDVFTAVQLEVKGEKPSRLPRFLFFVILPCFLSTKKKTKQCCYFYSSEWCCAKSKNMSGVMERSVTFQCPYAPQHHNDTMFLCKGDGASNCTDMMGQSRFVLSNVSSSSFSVTVTKLEAGDAGTYWCGSGPEANVGNFTRFHLSVGERDADVKTTSVSCAVLYIRCRGHKVKTGTKVQHQWDSSSLGFAQTCRISESSLVYHQLHEIMSDCLGVVFATEAESRCFPHENRKISYTIERKPPGESMY